MKIKIENYTFNAGAKTITFTDYVNIRLDAILLITNVTDNIIIYNFADATKGGTVATNVLTLTYDTTSMADTDKLLVYYDDVSVSQSVDTGLTGLATTAKQDDIITAIGAIPSEVQYTEGDVDASITGTALMFRNESTNIVPASLSDPLPIRGTVGLDLTGTDLATQTTLSSIDTNINSVDTRLNSIDSKVPALGQALDTGSVPVVLTAAQVSTLTPPAAITGFATETTLGSALTSLQLIDDSIYTDGSGTVTKGIAILGQDGTNPQAIKTDAAGELQVDVLTMPTVAVTQSGTWDEVGINDSGNSITVDYATTGSGTATGALRVELPTNGTGVIATVGAVTAITNALPAGTNTLGSVKSVPSDIDINGSNANHADKYYTNAGAVTDGIVWSPAAGKRWHVLTLYINVSAAATVTLEDDLAGGDVARWKGELAANSGVVLTYDKEHPFCSAEDAADLIITTSAGNVYVQAVGYEV